MMGGIGDGIKVLGTYSTVPWNLLVSLCTCRVPWS